MNLKKTLKVLAISIVSTLVIFMSGCADNSRKSLNKSSKMENESIQEEESEEKPLLSDLIEIVSVESGWFNDKYPQINIKFRNKSGKAISDWVKIKYQLVENDEVFDEGFIYLHSGTDIEWDNGLSKSKTIQSQYGYTYGGPQHTITAKVCFGDNSPIWEGKISTKLLF